jgi:hypothetical protein
MIKQTAVSHRAEILIVVLALVIAVNSQLSGIVNPYAINDDTRLTIYWMQQFRDGDLFQNDLLTDYARYVSPWGVVAVYRLLSPFADPVVASKLLPVVLFAVSALFLFKLVASFAGRYAGFVTSLIFMLSPIFIACMSGAQARAFAYPLFIIFLYYLVKEKHGIASVILALQSLFYVPVFFLSTLTFFFTAAGTARKKILFFVLALAIGLSALLAQYAVTRDPAIGTVRSKEAVMNDPVFRGEGRPGSRHIPTPPLFEKGVSYFCEPVFGTNAMERAGPVCIAAVLLLIVFMIVEAARGTVRIPRALIAVPLSGIIMYGLSDLFFLKLYYPARYLAYSMRLSGLIVCAVALCRLVSLARPKAARRIGQGMLIVCFAATVNVNRDAGLIDQSRNRALYEFIETLPKDAVIAAHPYLADGIPLFAKRKVFISNELSQPFHSAYWEEVKRRTHEFFDAYYAEDPSDIAVFCRVNGIDYVVVKGGHFSERYLEKGTVYFEPFRSAILLRIGDRRRFALQAIPRSRVLFEHGDIFVVGKEAFENVEG